MVERPAFNCNRPNKIFKIHNDGPTSVIFFFARPALITSTPTNGTFHKTNNKKKNKNVHTPKIIKKKMKLLISSEVSTLFLAYWILSRFSLITLFNERSATRVHSTKRLLFARSARDEGTYPTKSTRRTARQEFQ